MDFAGRTDDDSVRLLRLRTRPEAEAVGKIALEGGGTRYEVLRGERFVDGCAKP
jgi:hypothetical protein